MTTETTSAPSWLYEVGGLAIITMCAIGLWSCGEALDGLNKYIRDHNGATDWCVRAKATLAEPANNSEARLILEHQFRDECWRDGIFLQGDGSTK